jgi:hypothetical protein
VFGIGGPITAGDHARVINGAVETFLARYEVRD